MNYLNQCGIIAVLPQKITIHKVAEKFTRGTPRCHMYKASIINLQKIQDWARVKVKNKENNQISSEITRKGRIRKREENSE